MQSKLFHYTDDFDMSNLFNMLYLLIYSLIERISRRGI